MGMVLKRTRGTLLGTLWKRVWGTEKVQVVSVDALPGSMLDCLAHLLGAFKRV